MKDYKTPKRYNPTIRRQNRRKRGTPESRLETAIRNHAETIQKLEERKQKVEALKDFAIIHLRGLLLAGYGLNTEHIPDEVIWETCVSVSQSGVHEIEIPFAIRKALTRNDDPQKPEPEKP